MSGSPFDTLNRDIVNSSDYTRKLSDSTKWKIMQKNMARGFGPNPIKKNGVRYQSNFFVDTKGNPTIDQSGCVVAARNYELLQSISRGKYYSNPSLDGAAAGKYDMWFSNCLSISYQQGCNEIGVCSGGDYYAPILMTNLYSSADASNSPFFYGGQGYDMIPFPKTCLDDCSYNGLVPGFIEDPSNVIFKRKCIGSLAAVARPISTNLRETQGWLRDLTSIKFRYSPYYWKGVLAQPLNKYSFPKRVPLYYQGPSEQASFRPQTFTSTGELTNDPALLLEAFCKGNAAYN